MMCLYLSSSVRSNHCAAYVRKAFCGRICKCRPRLHIRSERIGSKWQNLATFHVSLCIKITYSVYMPWRKSQFGLSQKARVVQPTTMNHVDLMKRTSSNSLSIDLFCQCFHSKELSQAIDILNGGYRRQFYHKSLLGSLSASGGVHNTIFRSHRYFILDMYLPNEAKAFNTSASLCFLSASSRYQSSWNIHFS